jgi:hypothetical protein
VNGLDGSPATRGHRLFRGLCRWANGVARHGGDDLPANAGAALHGAQRPTLPAGCGVAGAACRGPGSASPVWSADGHGSRSGLGACCPDVGRALSNDQHELAAGLDAAHGLL